MRRMRKRGGKRLQLRLIEQRFAVRSVGKTAIGQRTAIVAAGRKQTGKRVRPMQDLVNLLFGSGARPPSAHGLFVQDPAQPQASEIARADLFRVPRTRWHSATNCSARWH